MSGPTVSRDVRLDLIRGFAMVTLAVNHVTEFFRQLGVDGHRVPTLTQYGFSGAAEILFTISGYMCGLVYLHRTNITEMFARRAATIYLYNLVAFVFSLVIVLFSDRTVAELTAFQYIFDDPAGGTVRFLLLMGAPHLLNILPLFVVLILLTPAAIWLCRRSAGVLFGLSFSLYLVAQSDIWPRDPGTWSAYGPAPTFNLLAWQFLYIAGMVAGSRRFHLPAFAWLSGAWWRPAAILAAFLAVAFVNRWVSLGYLDVPGVDKITLGPVRLLHTMLALASLASLLVLLDRWLDTFPAQAFARVGRHPLACYAASIVATYGFFAIDFALRGGYAAYLAAEVAILAVLWVMATANERGITRISLGKESVPRQVPGE